MEAADLGNRVGNGSAAKAEAAQPQGRSGAPVAEGSITPGAQGVPRDAEFLGDLIERTSAAQQECANNQIVRAAG